MDNFATGDIGRRLQHARQQRGLSLRDAARLTKLSTTVLQAIERNDFESLPAGIYRRAYLRTVAVEVGLSPNEIVADYRQQFEPAIVPVAPETPDALQQRLIEQLTPSPRRAAVTLAALTALALAWFVLRPGYVEPAMPAREAARELVGAPLPLGHTATFAIDQTRDAVSLAATLIRADVPLRVEMTAIGWCWVAAEADGERVMYRLMEPGERVVLNGRRLISLRLGDAGSMTLSINDGASQSLGRRGEVVELEVSPDNVESLRDAAAPTVSGN